jgi:hypothetical protein
LQVDAWPQPSDSGDDIAPSGMAQVTSVSQLSDVKPTDWAFQALQSLVERYGCIAGYPDLTYRGSRALTRYEFAAGLNACLDKIQELLAAATADFVKKQDLETIKALQETFAAELATLRGRVDGLEVRTATLEQQQFSTTTKLQGFVVMGVQGRTANRGDRNPRNGIRDTDDPGTNINLISHAYISLTTQFSPRDFLYMSLWQINGSGDPRLTNDGRPGYDFFNLPLQLGDLNYRVLIGDKLALLVGTEGVFAGLAFRGPNRAEGAFTGALSYFAQRNPVLNIGFGRGGAALDWQFAKRASLQAIHASNVPGVFQKSGSGQGNITNAVQLALTPTDTLDVAFYYVNDFAPTGNLLTFVGDEQLSAVNPLTGVGAPLRTHGFGTTVNWQIRPKLALGGWFGYTSSNIQGEPGRVQTTNWMVYLNLPDLFGPGNLGGLYIGQPPKITHSTLPLGSNVPDTLDGGGGRAGGQPGTTIHTELFYRWQLNDNISITPGVMVIFQPGHTPDSQTIGVGAIRTTFSF